MAAISKLTTKQKSHNYSLFSSATGSHYRDAKINLERTKSRRIKTSTAFHFTFFAFQLSSTYMDKTDKTNRYAADKIALLGLFIVALLIARFIIASRSAIVLSGPIKLPNGGLSVSMPTGNGWQSDKQWRYKENGFTLSSFFAPGSGSVTTLTRCRYLLAATKTTMDTLFEQTASDVDGVIEKTDQAPAGELTIDWAYIKSNKTLLEMFFGTVRLPNSRRLDIEVHQTAGDAGLAEQVFKQIAGSITFKDNQLLRAGSEIVSKIKTKGLDKLLHDKNHQTLFLIKNAAKQVIGFTMDVRTDSDKNAQLNMRAASFYYFRGRFPQEQASFLKSSNNLDEFTWKSETSSLTNRSNAELALDKTGIMTVRQSNAPAQEKNYQLSATAIPDIFLDLVLSQMLDSNYKKIVVDTIGVEGKITPVLISRIEPEDTAPPPTTNRDEEKALYVLDMKLLDGRGFSERVYLDKQKQISKILLQHRAMYLLERTNSETILRQFPERADWLLQNYGIREQNQQRF